MYMELNSGEESEEPGADRGLVETAMELVRTYETVVGKGEAGPNLDTDTLRPSSHSYAAMRRTF
jgi:hypothetical protein